MKPRPIAFALLLAFAPAAVALPRVAHAQGAQDDALTKAARARFQEGVDAFDKGNFEAARASFTQAYALKQHPAVLLNLAQSCLKSGHYLEAARDFQKYATDPLGDKKAEAAKGLADARSKLGRLDVTAPAGSDITVDADAAGRTPLNEAIDVEAGNHTVKARMVDGTSSEQKISVTAGQVMPVRFAAAATVVTPPVNPPVNPENPNPPVNNPPTNPNPPVNPPPTNPPMQSQPMEHPAIAIPIIITGGVLAVAGFVLGGVFAGIKGQANSNLTDVQNQITDAANKDKLPTNGLCNTALSMNPPAAYTKYTGPCGTLNSDASSVNQDATVANLGIVIGIVGLAGAAFGVVWYFVGAKPKASGSAMTTKFSPWIAPGLGGLSFSGTF